jgi:hypothetical protein
MAGLLTIVASGIAVGDAVAKTRRIVRVYQGDVLISASLNWLSSSNNTYSCGQEGTNPQLFFHANGSANIQIRARKVKITYVKTTRSLRVIFDSETVSEFPFTGTWRRKASYSLQRTGDFSGCDPSVGNDTPPETSGCGTVTLGLKKNKVTGEFVRGKKNAVGLLVAPAGDDLFKGACPDESLKSATLLLTSKTGSWRDFADGDDKISLQGSESERLEPDDLSMIGPFNRTGDGQWNVDWSATLKRVD